MKKNSFRKGAHFLQAALLLLAVILFCGCASGKSGMAVSSSSHINGSSSAKNSASEKNNLKDVSEEEPPAPTITETATPEPTDTPEPTETAAPEPEPVINGRIIAIDAGHQSRGNSDQEPVGPGAAETKAKVSSGTYGPASGLNEYELNLEVSLKLRDELAARGYEVYMIRETNEVDISNRERAELAASSGADILVRIHANGSEDPSVAGALTMAPSADNPYVGSLAPACQELSRDILDAFCASTGAASQGVYITDTMSGINWSTIPVTIVEMGYMTNAEEDLRMASGEYQQLMVQGIANGIDAYFAG